MTPEAKIPDRTARHRQRRRRILILRQAWRGRAGTAPCGGPATCPWAAAGLACRCGPAPEPCRCARELWQASHAGCRPYVGEAAASLIASAHVGLARRQLREGEEESAATARARIELARLMVRIERDLRRAEAETAKSRREDDRLALERRRFESEEKRAASPWPFAPLDLQPFPSPTTPGGSSP